MSGPDKICIPVIPPDTTVEYSIVDENATGKSLETYHHDLVLQAANAEIERLKARLQESERIADEIATHRFNIIDAIAGFNIPALLRRSGGHDAGEAANALESAIAAAKGGR